MYRSMKEKDPGHSGTGVFYQAVPAVGVDGRNIMKLIPVQMVNGQFVKSQISQLKTDPTPPKAPVGMAKKAAFSPSTTEQIVRKHVALMNAFPHQVGLDLGNSLNKHPLKQLQQSVNVMATVPPMALPVANSGTSVRPPCQLPGTVKFPAAPRGQFLQIPPKAHVPTVPGPELPLGRKKQTLPPSASSSASSGLPGVTFLSPITTVNQGLTAQKDSPLETLKLICKIANPTSCGPPSKRSQPHLNLIPNIPQRPNSPIKWSIEEDDNSTAPTLDPIDSSLMSKILRVLAETENAGKPFEDIKKPSPAVDPINSSLTSEILRVAAERENAGKHCDIITKSVFGSRQGKSGQVQENTLVMCNGKYPQQQQSVHLMTIVPQMAAPVAKSGKCGRPPCDLQVTAKSPALPRGQFLQIPPKSHVPSVPSSELSSSMKKQSFTPSASSSPSSGLPAAVYMSPITSVNRGVTQHSDSEIDALKWLCTTSNKTSCGPPSKGSQPRLKLIPNVPQRPNSPIKWSVEEDDNSTAPPLDHIDSSVMSEILRVAAQRENAGKHHDVISNPVSGSSQGKSGQVPENTMVMWNGKLFFVAKNCSPPKSDAPIAVRKCYEFNKPIVASPQQSLVSVSPQKKQGLGILSTKESRKVNDLCGDDAPKDSSQQAALAHMSAVTPVDEDNVIFVSYTPPKPQDFRVKTQMAALRETNRTDTSSLSNVTEQKSLDGTSGALGRREPGQSVSFNTVKNHTDVGVSTVVNMHGDDDDDDDDGSNIDSQQSTSTQQLENMDIDPSSIGIGFGIEKDTHKVESSMTSTTSGTSSPVPESCQRADDLLRRIFGITADVKISLQRIDGASVGSLPAESLESESIRSAEDREETTSGFKDGELLLTHHYSQQETGSCQELSEDSATQCPHSDVALLECTNFSPKETCSDVETEPLFGYVEPIDEDFLSTDGNDFHHSQDTASRSPSCTDLNANTRRLGRKRKRPTCPCCIAGTKDPAARSGAKSEEPERWAWTTERTSRKGGRAKASSKDVKTPGSIGCLTAKNGCQTSEDPASDGVSTASTDSDELKLHEQITRLKELLREKEAALELMRNGTS
ncbi:uncharacterized protein lrif1 [Anoplopoma fimbria]|uniref:uncharacterized protein lrif1 n=1 Tax=Anoplopoma fimbria TaxID=229290 RepID=UPI0023EA977C|nr:uncharacterized protein lrif1 [Anoplopoma fimbria]